MTNFSFLRNIARALCVGAILSYSFLAQAQEKENAVSPVYSWRGCMIDLSRHFFTTDFLRKQIDFLAEHKINRLHLHLTDAGGWRIQIKKYPRLTEIGAWRTESDWHKWWIGGDRRYLHEGDSAAYGGYYTQDELRALVAYAQERGITIVPEIEMPGHSEEVTATYPELKCVGNEGAQADMCPSNEATYTFLENILQEVIQIFPSHWIHIGGDEASRDTWLKCTRCQQKAKELGFNHVNDLQGYLIRRIQRFLTQNGREMIAWDEALEDTTLTGATIMVWRNAAAARQAIRQGNKVIMSPTSHCYFDYHQDAPYLQPTGIGGYNTFNNVASFDPAAGLSTEERRHILGLQGNLWTEFVETPEHAEYMLYPRELAIAEIGLKGRISNISHFRKSIIRQYPHLDSLDIHYFDLRKEVGERPESRNQKNSQAADIKVVYHRPFSTYYLAGGNEALIDGTYGGWSHTDGRWQGFCQPADTIQKPYCMDLTLDLGKVKAIHNIDMEFLQNSEAWIYLPEDFRISISKNGRNFREIFQKGTPREPNSKPLYVHWRWAGTKKARYIRLQARAPRPGEWVFSDEVRINEQRGKCGTKPY